MSQQPDVPNASTNAVLFFDSCAMPLDNCDPNLNCLTRKEVFCIHRFNFKAAVFYPETFSYLTGKKDDEVVIIFFRFIHKIIKTKPVLARAVLSGKLHFLIITNDKKFFKVAKLRYGQRRHHKLDLSFVGGKNDGYILSRGIRLYVVNLNQKSEVGNKVEKKRNLVDKVNTRWNKIQSIPGSL